jgi:GNAT superfamily N-acetyltransferase
VLPGPSKKSCRYSAWVTEGPTIREVTDPADPAIEGFGLVQNAAYFAPETLIPARYIPQMLGGTASRSNHLLVAEEDGRVVGGVLFHHLGAANVGFSSFMAVAREHRGRGIARRLHERRFDVLDAAAGKPVPGVFIDVVAPERLTSRDLERESQAGSDPRARRDTFAALGFRQVDVRYEQPVGGPNGGPVTNMDLLFCPRDPVEEIPSDWVAATLREYWRGWLGEDAATRHARALRKRMPEEMVALLPNH